MRRQLTELEFAEHTPAHAPEGERFYEAEIHRIKRELLLAQGADEAMVDEHDKQAVEVARQLDAKL